MTPLEPGPIPYYHQISAILMDKISSGEFLPEERLPSEQQLQNMFKVSRATIRQALDTLEKQGAVERRKGKGSFVSEARQPPSLSKMTCLIEDLIALGIPARNIVREVGIVPASRGTAEAMDVKLGDKVLSFVRMVLVEDEPFAFQRIFLPARLAESLNERDLAEPRLLSTLREKCGLDVAATEHTIESVLADVQQAEQLKINPGAALLSVARSSFAEDGAVIEHSIKLYRADRMRFRIRQVKSPDEESWTLDSVGLASEWSAASRRKDKAGNRGRERA